MMRPFAFGLLFLVACVGDNIVPVDGGPDVTAEAAADVVSDATKDATLDAPDTGAPGLYVDSTLGNDSNAGTKALPLKTIKHAFTLAKSGDTVFLFAGTFDGASGDDFTTPVPDGVSIVPVALSADGGIDVTLQGSSSSLVFAGSGGLTGVSMSGFSTAIKASTGTQTISNVALAGGAFAAVTGSAQTTLSNVRGSASAGIGTVANTAHLTITNGAFAPLGSGVSCGDTANLAVTNVTIDSPSGAVFVANATCTATITSTTITNLSGVGVTLTGNPTVTLDTVNVDKGAPVNAQGGVLTIKNGSFTNSASDALSLGGTTVIVTGNFSISGCGRFGFEYASGSVAATGMQISGCALGGIYSQASLKLRSCTIKNNTGTGVYGLGSISWDLGTSTSLGTNTFQSNSTTDVDVQFASNQTVSAEGNTWNALVQGADSTGHYTSGASSGTNASGTNFKTGSTSNLALAP